jgi:hypothetical protein
MVARPAGNEKWTPPYPAAAPLLSRVSFDMLSGVYADLPKL